MGKGIEQSHLSCTGISVSRKESQASIGHDLHETENRLVILRRDYYFIVLGFEIEIENVRLVMHGLEAGTQTRGALFRTVCSPILWCALTGNLYILTMYVWIVLRLCQAIDAHSGYEVLWSLHHLLPFWAGADHHDLYHEKSIGTSYHPLDTEYTPDALQRQKGKQVEAKKTQ
ncbi:hypothetical protein OAory_01114420 [Aspergillus oryzae]|uniref:Fatty acid hydroxylase domain-containing protein n=1 Tax=Aspergillus oryzae TaxID=5062 RepID=A0A1S9D7R4_ASPOZ|nr:uncharacterized protein G4B84_002147 [Aspergillus flavus NRRL3357]OOO05105.1 hypothetical protein OAory_01114420 [Aspergillus oryzae]QMW26858.1 hypothetical protein G4B84_002147 [Aspergillus flavus NRRL3357]QMW38938.1 hypothetical protein G4B11_002218 [Aspergillus flavus]